VVVEIGVAAASSSVGDGVGESVAVIVADGVAAASSAIGDGSSG